MIDAPPPLQYDRRKYPFPVKGFSDCPVCGRPPTQRWPGRGSYHLFRDERSAIAFKRNRLCQVCQDMKAKIESTTETGGARRRRRSTRSVSFLSRLLRLILKRG